MNQMPVRNSLPRRLALYSMAAGGAAVGFGAQAAPQSVIGLPASVTAADESCENLGIDATGNGDDDFRFQVCDFDTFRSASVTALGSNRIVAVECLLDDTFSSTYAGNLAPGSQVDEQLDFQTSRGMRIDPNISSDKPECDFDITGAEVGYLGFELNSGSPEYAGPFYGYFEVRFSTGSTTLEVLCGEFEGDADAPITIRANCGQAENGVGSLVPGEPTPIPVGGALPLSIGLLVIGAAALRRRQKMMQ